MRLCVVALAIMTLLATVPDAAAQCPRDPMDCYDRSVLKDRGESVEQYVTQELVVTVAVYEDDEGGLDPDPKALTRALPFVSVAASGHEGIQMGVGDEGGLVFQVNTTPYPGARNVTVTLSSEANRTPDLAWSVTSATVRYDRTAGNTSYGLLHFEVERRPPDGRIDVPFELRIDNGTVSVYTGVVSFEVPEDKDVLRWYWVPISFVIFWIAFRFTERAVVGPPDPPRKGRRRP